MIQAITAGIQGVAGIVGGAIGLRQAKQEESQARQAYTKSRLDFEQMDFTNPYENMQNPYEDVTVSQQAAEFQAQQQQAALASTMQSLQGAAGGSGIAALAQSMANQQSINMQRASADIAKQERQNQMLRAQGTAQLQQLSGAAQMKVEQAEYGKQATLLGMDQQRLAAAQEARAAAAGQIATGVGAAVGGAAAAYVGGLSPENLGPDAEGNTMYGKLRFNPQTFSTNVGASIKTAGEE
jgi:hypothetical protein